MPIYAYKCASCGHSLDALQKLSDAPLSVCPACGQAALSKQVTAAGFQLKGSGWYATDFKGGGAAAAAATAKPEAVTESKPEHKPEAVPAAAACGSSCACH
ncbi:MAG: zinc ribbon domain-containing protein [Burkholderiales bacterium]|jgi:putative FmdB family regulatory protein|nr:zinc ribbon domain-containing protein [Burkholderiales bacterium]